MAVHAHPDDEASGGGILASYSDQGIQTIVVTCTNGEYGDAPGGIKPGQEGHDPEAVARLRLAELEKSASILKVSDDEIRAAMRHLFTDTHNVAEGAGAAALAGLLQERERVAGKRLAIILSGGNVDRETFASVLAN